MDDVAGRSRDEAARRITSPARSRGPMRRPRTSPPSAYPDLSAAARPIVTRTSTSTCTGLRRLRTTSDAERWGLAGGVLVGDLAPLEDEEWAESFAIGGFRATTSMFLNASFKRYLTEVVDGWSTEEVPQIRIAADARAR